MSYKYVKILVSIFCFSSSVSFAQTAECSQTQAMQAEQEAGYLDNWNAVYQSFTRFHFCDDAAISEGYNESITKLLAYKWQDKSLFLLFQNSPHFEDFVVQHVNEGVPYKRLKRIFANVDKHCPRIGQSFCKKIKDFEMRLTNQRVGRTERSELRRMKNASQIHQNENDIQATN